MSENVKPTKALVLLSGGVDSATCLGIACERFGQENVSAVGVFYGQRLEKELECSKKIAAHYGIQHHELNLSEIFKHSPCSLIATGDEVKDGTYDSKIAQSEDGLIDTYVPFRNGLMFAAVTSFAMSLYPDHDIRIILGIHSSDYAYADCSQEFKDAMQQAIELGTYGRVSIETPLLGMSKVKVVSIGLRIGVPYNLTWSCYKGEEKPCGLCASCIDRQKAFRENGQEDPAL